VPTRDSAPLGAPVWIDLSSSDPERAKTFYTQLFGWTFEETGEEFGNYVNFSKNGALIAGMMKNDGQSGAPDGWTTYLSSSDAKATVDAAIAAGGTAILEPMQVADLGTMAIVADPSGAVIGVWQPGEHRGFGLVGEAGAPVWHELHSRNYAAATAFYPKAFGWETAVMSDTDEFRYTCQVKDGEQYAGVMDSTSFLPEGVPSHWQVYFGAEDVDATLAKITELGGAVVQPAEDTPYGRLAGATDPTGALFKLSSLRV
jgi:predicted enzyme related to lactoylglutathione lyase